MLARSGRCLALAALALLWAAPGALAQGILIDRRPHWPIARSFEIREVAVDARVRDQVAEVQVSQTFHNPGSVMVESEYLFPLPEEGAIQNFVLLVDGKELPGRILPKDEARRIYEEVVRTKRDPALLEYMGRGLFRTSVFPIPPGADRKVTMRYTQICNRDRDIVEFAYPFGTQKFTAKPIQRLSLTLRIESRDAIKSLYSPIYDARIERLGDHDARVTLDQRDIVPTTDFRLVYTLVEGALGATVLSYRPSEGEDGYFLLLASPEVKAPDVRVRPKTVVFVLDRSGSMAGKKIEQARNALRFVLNNLRDDDTFNIVAYDDRVETFRPELQRYSPRTRDEAERFVDNIREGGSTNIDSALQTALAMVPDDDRPSYILFLTDGLPTAGDTNEMTIADHVKRANKYRARVFAFGVGFDVNARLLDRLSGGNSGTSEYVKPDENIETHVARFYSKMTSPVLSDIRIELTGTDVNRTYPRDLPDLFEGGQLVWSGRYRQGGRTTVRLTGKIGGERRSFEFPAELASTDRGTAYDFVERIWALRRVGFIIDQIDLHGQNRELTDELVALSTKYGILTPYTSFLADENVPLHAFRENADRARLSLNELGRVTGLSGVEQRRMKGDLQDATKAAEPFSQGAASLPAAGPVTAGTQAGGLGTYTPELQRAGGGQAQANQGQNYAMKRGVDTRSAVRAQARTEEERLLEARGTAPAGGMAGMGGMGMGGGMMAGRPAGANHYAMMMAGKPGQSVRLKDAEGNEFLAASVRQIGKKTFYFKENRWIDSVVKPEQDARAKLIKQFSDDFFKLANAQKSELNQYLTFDQPVTVELDGTVYRIEPVPATP
jgi:Ca-activated chloride channel family protein